MDKAFFETVMNSPLTGVFIGGLLALVAPWVAFRIERKRRKQEVKSNLIEATYLVYSHSSDEFIKLNDYWYNFHLQEHYRRSRENPQSGLKDHEVRLLHDYEILYKKSAEEHFAEFTRLYEQVIALNAKLNSLLVQVEYCFGTRDASKIRNIIDHVINRPGVRLLYKYGELEFKDLDSLGDRMESEQDVYINELKAERIKVIEIIAKELTL
jgi:hypothetical protein